MLRSKLISILLFLSFSFPAIGQINIAFLNKKDSLLNVFGSGWDNKIRVNNLPYDALVKVSAGNIDKVNTNEFIISRLGEVPYVKINVLQKNKTIYSLQVKVIRTKYSGSHYNPKMSVISDGKRFSVPAANECKVVQLQHSFVTKSNFYGPYTIGMRWYCGDAPVPVLTLEQKQEKLEKEVQLRMDKYRDSSVLIVAFDDIKISCPAISGLFPADNAVIVKKDSVIYLKAIY